jgi:hypothetical protein
VRQVRAGEHGDAFGTEARHVGDHLAHPLERAELDTFDETHHDRVVADVLGPVLEVGAQRLRRHRQHDDPGTRQRLLGIVGR